MILVMALLSLLVAGVFSPRIAVEANTQAQSEYVRQSEYVSGDSVSGWLLRLAASAPDQRKSAQPARPQACKSKANSFIF